jgi:transposase
VKGGRTGRPRVPDRAALAGIVFVLKTGISWNDLAQKIGCGSGATCWRRLREWQDAGVWRELHRVMLDKLGQLDLLDWSRAAVDSASVRAKRRGEATGPSPTDRGKAGSKYHMLATATACRYTPWSPARTPMTAACWRHCWTPTPAFVSVQDGRDVLVGNRTSCTPTRATTTRAAAATRPVAGSGYGSLGVGSRAPPASGGFAGVVERTMSWLLDFRRLALRYDRSESTISALLSLACALICHRRLARHSP